MTFDSRSVQAALCATLILTAPALAQGTAEERSACMGDAFRFCLSDIPNVAEIEACLIKNENRLTPACRAEFEPATKRSKLRREHFSR